VSDCDGTSLYGPLKLRLDAVVDAGATSKVPNHGCALQSAALKLYARVVDEKRRRIRIDRRKSSGGYERQLGHAARACRGIRGNVQFDKPSHRVLAWRWTNRTSILFNLPFACVSCTRDASVTEVQRRTADGRLPCLGTGTRCEEKHGCHNAGDDIQSHEIPASSGREIDGAECADDRVGSPGGENSVRSRLAGPLGRR
jgi:hypothetical protein